MRAIQTISGISVVFFIVHCYLDNSEEAKITSLMGILTMSLVFIIASHLYGIKNDIANEIRENHKNRINSANGTNSVHDAKK